ncbi:protein jagged-1b-like [Saccostrea echinata]|uniref:protein jagged-1b-like n=1 Tax=Saccostrea echinata TaxID=191078 RepID=UPI002A840217|nr:protein jagged-1b-like [Saccostrea echinata]
MKDKSDRSLALNTSQKLYGIDISRNKRTNQSATRACITDACKNFYLSSNAVDRNETTCSGIKVIGEGTSLKEVWWNVDLGDFYSIYSISVHFKEVLNKEDRQKGRFAGFSLYLSKSENRDNNSLCYKDGPELPPLKFSTICAGYGRYVIFYNERLDGVNYPNGYERQAYTDLCEVIVKGCNKTFYGPNCDKKCSANCEDQSCDIVNGTCLKCSRGWTGKLCKNKCPRGWFGLDCKQQCSGHCLNSEVCNHVTGGCDRGCTNGWKGTTCEEPCKNGTYGPGCRYNCSGNCLDDVHCNKQTGNCDTGCKPGYTGNSCKAGKNE